MIILALLLTLTQQLNLAQYYCGFSGDFCGQSQTDDSNAKTSLIILAFANIASNGTIIIDSANFPCALVNTWQQQGKKVLISIGGANSQWDNIFINQTTLQNAVTSILGILNTTTVDGIDLDMQDYSISPLNITNLINTVKPQMRGKLLTIAPQCPGVYQGQPIPFNTSTSTGGWNFWVPVLQNASSLIDLVMVQAYNNWYDGVQGGSLSYLQDVYLHWSNIKSPYCQGCNPLPNFTGVNGSKLAIGVLASSNAGGSAYFANNTIIKAFIDWTYSLNYSLAGMMMWDTHWDASNGFNISTTIIQQAQNNQPLQPDSPTKPMICTS